ncbi:MAG TPA: sugar-binding transcriptional regulator [Roseiarcus sp.]|jgi:DNA-binding transcriptional regulator LsrR (DeoR family)
MTANDNLGDQDDASSASSRRSPRLRQRVAWMYYAEEMTQSAIAEALGVGRITVVRLLAEARAMNEVRVSLSRDVAGLSRLEIELQKAYGVGEAIVAPLSSRQADPRAPIAAAAGEYISAMLQPDMKIGLGWGQTLDRALNFIVERQVPRLSVVSLVGGVTRARQANPAEFAWQFARIFQADCYLIAAPAMVDSAATKRTLIERCGLGEVFDFANSLDAAVVSVGSTVPNSTTNVFGDISEADQAALRARGVVGDILFNFFDVDGRLVDHPFNERAMSISIATLAKTPKRVLVSGGSDKVEPILGALKLFRPTVLITDEATAEALIARR